MTDPAEAKVDGENQNETSKLNDSTDPTNVTTTINVDDEADDSKAHLINANGGAGGGGDLEVKIVDGTATSSEAEVSFNGLGKDEVMKYADEPFWKKLRMILFVLFWIGWFAMLVTAIVIIVLAPRCPPRPDLKWYQTDAVYQVQPIAFKDTGTNGKGDFKGLKEKSSYIFDDLGIPAIWLSSVYKTDDTNSELAILDHKAMNGWFGATVGEFRGWMKSLLKEGKRVIMDLIPNQTSKKHEWFVKSQKKEGKYKDYYIWKENTDGNAPNNWVMADGNPMWTLDNATNAWYLHQLGADLPDLNLLNPDVMDEIKDIMSFWLNAGVAGFNVRDVEYLVEDPGMANHDANKTQTFHNNGTLAVLAEFRKVVEGFSDKPGRERVLFATVQDPTREQALAYWGPSTDKRLHIVAPVLADINDKLDAFGLKSLLENWLTDDRQQWMGYALGGPSVKRIASRMGTKANLTIAHAIQLLMPGTPFNYYGDEFGQEDVTVPGTDQYYKDGTDGYRTPMQWDSSKNAGFSTADKIFLPVGSDYKTNHVAAGSALFSESTPLKAFKELIKLREKESLQFGKTKVCAVDKGLLVFTRKAERFPYVLTLINVGSTPKTFNLEALSCVDTQPMGTVRFHSRTDLSGEEFNFHENAISLKSGDVVVVEFAPPEE